MKIYDISQELLGCSVYDGDPAPHSQLITSIKEGSSCNLTALSLCAHNGTHIDAPLHFIDGSADVSAIPLHKTVGFATVISASGDLSAKWAREALETARKADCQAARRILIKGNATVTLAAAEVFASEGVLLLGVESQSVGSTASPVDVHLALLGEEVVLLEGLRLSAVPDGVYLLAAQPINISGADGSPCRAVLVTL